MGRIRTARRSVFVVLFQGRTGSTYLIEGLNAHPQVDARGEVFKSEGDMAAGRRQLRKMREFLKSAPSTGDVAHGFKSKLRDVIDQTGFAHLLYDLDASVILLSRRNHIKHAVSHFNAMRLHEQTGKWNRHEKRKSPARLSIDPVEFDEYLIGAEERRQNLRRYVAALELPTLHVQYEYLLHDDTEVFNTVLHFIGVDVRPVTGSTKKNTGDDLRKVLDNFDELREHYRGTRYESMFGDEHASIHVPPTNPKVDGGSSAIFGLGLTRTGTTSLAAALRQLGVPTIHYPHDHVTWEELQAGKRLSVLDTYRAITDISVAPFYEQLDQLYPEARFILTTRDPDTWITSMRAHLASLRSEWDDFSPQFRAFTEWICEEIYGGLKPSDEELLARYKAHVEAVRDYFSERPSDLLVLDVRMEGAWQALAAFLGTGAPAAAFPHRNAR